MPNPMKPGCWMLPCLFLTHGIWPSFDFCRLPCHSNAGLGFPFRDWFGRQVFCASRTKGLWVVLLIACGDVWKIHCKMWCDLKLGWGWWWWQVLWQLQRARETRVRAHHQNDALMQPFWKLERDVLSSEPWVEYLAMFLPLAMDQDLHHQCGRR